MVPTACSIADHAQVNKMAPKNLAVVFGPTLLRPNAPKDDSRDGWKVVGVASCMVELLITNYEYFFNASS